MEILSEIDLAAAAAAVRQLLLEPLYQAPWTDWRGFWAGSILDYTGLVFYFLPIVPLLLLLPPRRLRLGIVLTGLGALAFLFGCFHAAMWLLTGVALHWLAEEFAREARRTDVVRWGPPLAAGTLLTAWYLGIQALKSAPLPFGLDGWLYTHAPWVFPYGYRGLAWEPDFTRGTGPAPLLAAALVNPHYVGTAYLAMRMLHYFSELKRDTLPAARRTRLNFLAYICYAPALMQGPIERYLTFQDELDTCHTRRSWRNVPPALYRILIGLAQCLIATLYFKPILWYWLGLGAKNNNRYYQDPACIAEYGVLYFGVFFQIFSLYLVFAGYCDCSAGIARLLGYRQIENFNMPWIATSMRDFWRRWHISLSQLLRDYLYIPFGGNRRHVLLNLCATFAICGLWHAPIPKVAIWGVLIGFMLWVNQRWVQWVTRLDATQTGFWPAVHRRWAKLRPLPQITAWLVTQHLFVFSLLIFFGGAGGLRVLYELIRRPLAWLLGW